MLTIQRFETIGKFVDFVASLDGPSFFRGQRLASWTLTPGLYRAAPNGGSNAEFYKHMEERSINELI